VLLAVSLLFVIATVAVPVQLGTTAQVIGLVTFQVSYPAVLVRARLATIGPQYEEAAMDLGASPLGALRRIILPMLLPAIFASTVLVFADVIDDFVLVRYLSGNAATEPVSVKIYNTARVAPTPALNALATLLLVAALTAVVIGFLVYRHMTRADTTTDSATGQVGTDPKAVLQRDRIPADQPPAHGNRRGPLRADQRHRARGAHRDLAIQRVRGQPHDRAQVPVRLAEHEVDVSHCAA
jgi:ABC-type Fe3+ transport system permease subunit